VLALIPSDLAIKELLVVDLVFSGKLIDELSLYVIYPNLAFRHRIRHVVDDLVLLYFRVQVARKHVDLQKRNRVLFGDVLPLVLNFLTFH
jgi:hypothetical protein